MWQILPSLQESVGRDLLGRGSPWGAGAGVSRTCPRAADPPGLQEAGVSPGTGLTQGGCCLSVVAELKGAAGTSQSGFLWGLVKLLLVLVLEERTQSLAASFAMAEVCSGQADQGLLLCAKVAHEKRDNPCPGHIPGQR